MGRAVTAVMAVLTFAVLALTGYVLGNLIPSELELGHVPRAHGPPVPAGSASPQADTVILVGAGDIAECGSQMDDRTAELVDQVLRSAEGPAYVFAAGDNVRSGTLRDYLRCFDPSWGRFLDHTIAVPGNHDYRFGSLDDYRAYFGGAAGDPSTTWYNLEIGSWQVLALDTECPRDGGCGVDAAQTQWLADQLASDHHCSLAIMHRARFSSGGYGSSADLNAIWRLLANAGVEVVLSGHDHDYERFAPMDASGAPDDAGVRQFVVGTGGAELGRFRQAQLQSEVRLASHGVMRLDLLPATYRWEFLGIDGGQVLDSGSGDCHE